MLIKITEKNVTNWSFNGYVGVSMIIILVAGAIYKNNFLGLSQSFDGVTEFFSNYVGLYRLIDVGMSGNKVYKAMLSAHIFFIPIPFLCLLPLRIKKDIFLIERLLPQLILLLAASFMFFYGPISEDPSSRGRRFIALIGSGAFGVGLFISFLTALLSWSAFAAFTTFKNFFIRGK